MTHNSRRYSPSCWVKPGIRNKKLNSQVELEACQAIKKSKLILSDPLPPVRLHFLKASQPSKWCHLLGAKCLKLWAAVWCFHTLTTCGSVKDSYLSITWHKQELDSHIYIYIKIYEWRIVVTVVSTSLACVRTWVQFSVLQNNKNKLDTHAHPSDTCQPENKAGGSTSGS